MRSIVFQIESCFTTCYVVFFEGISSVICVKIIIPIVISWLFYRFTPCKVFTGFPGYVCTNVNGCPLSTGRQAKIYRLEEAVEEADGYLGIFKVAIKLYCIGI